MSALEANPDLSPDPGRELGLQLGPARRQQAVVGSKFCFSGIADAIGGLYLSQDA